MDPNEIRMRELENEIERFHAELTSRKPTKEDMDKALRLTGEYLPLVHRALLGYAEEQFDQKYIH